MKFLANALPKVLVALFWVLGGADRLEAAVPASSLAIIGYDDHADSFSVMALDILSAGEVIYFTNNGWSSSQSRFNGAHESQGAGNESLIKLTLTQNVAKGSVISSTIDDASWQWTKSGTIPGQVGGMAVFSDLALDYESDQIYAFQGLTDNPLLNPTNFIYALHFGSVDYPGFSDAEDTLTGDAPDDLSEAAQTAFAHTNLTFHGDADGNHSAWGLNFGRPAVNNLVTNGGTSAEWLNVIANSSNWHEIITLESAPEPSRAVLTLAGLGLVLGRRRKITVFTEK